MDWSNERYVRLYTRDTVGWMAKSWQARALLTFMIRKADRSGVIDVGGHGLRGLAVLVGMPELEVVQAMPELLADDTVIANASVYVLPNYLEAQEAIASDAQRARESRERRRAKSLGSEGCAGPVLEPPDGGTDHPPDVTNRDGTPGGASRNVTKRAENVTPASPVLAKPSEPCLATDSDRLETEDFSRLFARLPARLRPPAGRSEDCEDAMREAFELGADLEHELDVFAKRNKKTKVHAPAAALAAFLRMFDPEKAKAKRKPAKSTKATPIEPPAKVDSVFPPAFPETTDEKYGRPPDGVWFLRATVWNQFARYIGRDRVEIFDAGFLPTAARIKAKQLTETHEQWLDGEAKRSA